MGIEKQSGLHLLQYKTSVVENKEMQVEEHLHVSGHWLISWLYSGIQDRNTTRFMVDQIFPSDSQMNEWLRQ